MKPSLCWQPLGKFVAGLLLSVVLGLTLFTAAGSLAQDTQEPAPPAQEQENTEQDSTEQDSTEQDSTEQDSAEQDSTEQDSAEQNSTEQDSAEQEETISTAWIVVEGQRLFEVAGTQDLTAKQRAKAINGELTELMNSSEPLAVIVDVPRYTPIIYNVGFGRTTRRQLLSVTAADLQAVAPNIEVNEETLKEQAEQWAEEIETWLTRARLERSGEYFLRAVVTSLIALSSALALHYLLKYLWRRYVFSLLPPATAQPQPGATALVRPEFSLARFTAQLMLLALRAALWLWVLLFVVRQFRVTRIWATWTQDRLESLFVGQSLPLGETQLSLADILVLLVQLGGMVLLAKVATNVLRSRLLHTSGLSLGMQAAIAVLVRYAILFVGVIAVLQLWGINLSSLTLLASALGVGLGLGLQNIAKDISSGLVLVFERPIQVGDFVELNGRLGVVDRIGPRSTDIRTLDQVSIIVPNSRFLEHDVVNWSHRNPLSRIHIPIGVSYNCHPETVKSILLDVGREHPHVMAAPSPEVFLMGFGDSSLKFELLVWIRRPQLYPKIRSDLNFAIAAAFRKNGIEIPFPQRDIHLPESALPVTLSEDSLRHLAKPWPKRSD